MRKRRLASALIASVAAGIASKASASYMYDGMGYANGTTLGATGNWANGGTGQFTAVNPGDLGYPIAQVGSTTGLVQGTTSSARVNRLDLANPPVGLDHLGSYPSGSGTLYYSLDLKIPNITSAGTGGSFIAGFNNSSGTVTGAVTQAGARLQVRKDLVDATKYNVGIRNDITGAGTSPITWDGTQFTTGDTIFLVAEYEFNQASNLDDVAKLWINGVNMQTSDFGAASAPVTALTSTGGDISALQILSFFLRENTVSGNTVQFDEVRVGTSWAEVTPVPEPVGFGVLTLGAFAALVRRRRQAG